MNKLDELIQKLCPEGVPFKKLIDVCDYVDYRGKTPKKVESGIFLVTAKNIRKGYIDYESSKEYIASDDFDNVMRRGTAKIGDILITTEAPCGNVALVDREDIALAQRVIKYRCNDEINPRFLLHILLGKEFQNKLAKASTGGTVKGIKGSKLHLLEVPVPPLEVQKEIVRLLDNFTAKTEELQAELNKEYEARKKQYECYRDSLLNGELDKLIQPFCSDEIEYKFFGDCAKIIRGASPRPIKNFITAESDGVNWIKIGDVKPGEKYITASAEKITLEGAKKSRPVKKGDFILSNSMSFGRPYILKIDGCVHDGWLVISEFSESYTSDFLYYLLSSNMCQNQMKKKASFGGAVQNLKADTVRELFLPVPPLEAQQKIVHFLDELSMKIAKIQDELLEELESRQKQYEFYRDKLLTFKELNESEVN